MACTAYERRMAERSPGSWQWASRELQGTQDIRWRQHSSAILITTQACSCQTQQVKVVGTAATSAAQRSSPQAPPELRLQQLCGVCHRQLKGGAVQPAWCGGPA